MSGAAHYRLDLPASLVWLLVASSSVVAFEPAPYDLMAIGLTAAFFLLGLRIPRALGPPLLLLGLFVLGNILAGIAAAEPVQTLGYMSVSVYLLLTWLLFTCLIAHDTARFTSAIWNGYVAAALLAAIVGLLAYFHLIPGHEMFLYWGRARGLFKDANVFGPFLVPVALYLLATLESARGARMMWTLIMLLTVISAIFLSFSRGAWVNFALSLMVYFALRLLTSRSSAEVARMLLIGGLAAAAALMAVSWTVSTKQVSSLLSERALLVQDYDLERFDVIGSALREALERPVGIGPGRSNDEFAIEPHNLYAHVLVETGWLGALAFGGFLLLSLLRGLHYMRQDSALQVAYIVAYSALIGTLLESVIIHSTHWRHLYLLLAMVWGPVASHATAARISRRSNSAIFPSTPPSHRNHTTHTS